MSLRERVHALRKEHGWSQGELAEKVGADPAQISRYENGRITPSADVVVRIAEVFDVSTDYLLVDDAPADPSAAATKPSANASPKSANSATKTSPWSSASSTPSSPRPASKPSPAASADCAAAPTPARISRPLTTRESPVDLRNLGDVTRAAMLGEVDQRHRSGPGSHRRALSQPPAEPARGQRLPRPAS